MIAAARQQARLETILERQRRRANARSRGRRLWNTVAPDDVRNALARVACELDPMTIEEICKASAARRFARTAKALGLRPTTIHRVVTGQQVQPQTVSRARRALVIAGYLREAS